MDPTQIQLMKVLNDERLQAADNRRRYGRGPSVFSTLFAQLRGTPRAQASRPAPVASRTPRKAHS